MTDLRDRVVLVTGGNGGIGLGLATGCAKAGAHLVIWGTNEDKLRSSHAVLSEHGTTVIVRAVDVGDERAVVDGFAAAVGEMGRVDAVFANAGISHGRPFVDQTVEQWRGIMNVNLEGAFLTLREGARHMIDRGEGGALVGVGSVSAYHGAPGAQAYAASKAGIMAMMSGLAVELARHRIRCNSLVPGWTDTEMTAPGRTNERFVENTTRRTPVRRWGRPSDFEAVGAFLADPTLEFLTGDEIVVDGGYTRF